MFDLGKLGDMTKMAKQAQQMQASQEKSRNEQMNILKKISDQLETVISLLRQNMS